MLSEVHRYYLSFDRTIHGVNFATCRTAGPTNNFPEIDFLWLEESNAYSSKHYYLQLL